MSDLPLVSVVINCFNGEQYLAEALDSVFAQTYKSWEIIFWDNASTDKSAEIAKSYGDRVRYFLAPKTTPLGEARNLALKKSTGDLIAILDSDDVWSPNRLTNQVEKFWNSDCAVCYSSSQLISKDGKLLREEIVNKKTGFIFEGLLNQFDITVSTLLIKRDVLNKGGFEFDLEMVGSEEYNLFMRMAARHKFCIVNDCLAKIRVHAGSLTGRAISRWAYEREYTLEKIKAENPGIEIKYPDAFKEAYARANYYKARYLVDQGKINEARKELAGVMLVNYKYFGLFLILLLPRGVWNFIHDPSMKQSFIPKIVKMLRLKR